MSDPTAPSGSTLTDGPFKRFAERHESVNRWFRSTDVAYTAARMLALQKDGGEQALSILPKEWRWHATAKQYRGRYSEHGRATRATVADLLQDLKDGWVDLLEAVIVNEVGGLEIFLREWAIDALRAALAPGVSALTTSQASELSVMLTELAATPYASVSLRRIGKAFPTLKATLTATTHLRAFRPLLAPAAGDVTLEAVTDLWREVRNLILHHDRIVHERFARLYSNLWLALQMDARDRGAHLIARRCRTGLRLPLVTRHAVFCLTSCFQTAVVLYLATGGPTTTPRTSTTRAEA